MIRTVAALKRLTTFQERYEYLRLTGRVGESTFGSHRYLNQLLYTSPKWRRLRDEIIVRDLGCDLGVDGYEIHDRIIIHHMNPITVEDVELDLPKIYDPTGLICTSHRTHEAIHFSDSSLLPRLPPERRPNDMIPWRTSHSL